MINDVMGWRGEREERGGESECMNMNERRKKKKKKKGRVFFEWQRNGTRTLDEDVHRREREREREFRKEISQHHERQDTTSQRCRRSLFVQEMRYTCHSGGTGAGRSRAAACMNCRGLCSLYRSAAVPQCRSAAVLRASTSGHAYCAYSCTS